MQTVNAYYYPNEVEVQFNIDPTLTLRNRILYTRTVKIYKGVDNVIRFTVKNSDQKPVNVTGWDLTFNMLSDDESSVVVSKAMTAIDANIGVITATLSDFDLIDLSNPRYKYSLSITDPYGSEQVLYADDNYGVRGEIELRDGHYPKFNPSINVQIPTTSNTNVFTSAITSDTPSRQQSAHHTAQFYFENFTGNVAVQSTLDTLPTVGNIGNVTLNWATVSTLPFVDQVAPTFYNFDGVYTAVRFEITADSGEVSKILYRA